MLYVGFGQHMTGSYSYEDVCYIPKGAIAQLGERLHGMQEVGGSIPPGSTTQSTRNRTADLLVCFFNYFKDLNHYLAAFFD